MKPTNKLKWVEIVRANGIVANIVLRQWWAPERNGQIVEHEGEWRDVPGETEIINEFA